MRLRILLTVGVFLVAAPGAAAAKFASYRLTIEGPGMPSSPIAIQSNRVIDRLAMATLLGTDRLRVERPRSTGPAYVLQYGFGVSDENGSRTETIRQMLYPFATGNPVVFTPRGQRIHLSHGAERFAPGMVRGPSLGTAEARGRGLATRATQA